MQSVRAMVVEDEDLYREMLIIALQSTGQIEIVGWAAAGGAAIVTARELKPDVVLMDIDLGAGENGIQVGRQIRREHPKTGIVLLSNHKCKHCLQAIPTREAAGWSYLLKNSLGNLTTLVRAVQGAALGLMILDPQLSEDLAPRRGSLLNHLTPRQLEILRLMAEGYSNAAIAKRVFLTEKSVEKYLSGIYDKLGIRHPENEPVHLRVKAVLIYLEETQPLALVIGRAEHRAEDA